MKQVRDWLLHWEEHHGIAVIKGKKGSKSKTTTKKAILLSGQPGIGKTTTARLVCQDLGFETLEVPMLRHLDGCGRHFLVGQMSLHLKGNTKTETAL